MLVQHCYYFPKYAHKLKVTETFSVNMDTVDIVISIPVDKEEACKWITEQTPDVASQCLLLCSSIYGHIQAGVVDTEILDQVRNELGQRHARDVKYYQQQIDSLTELKDSLIHENSCLRGKHDEIVENEVSIIRKPLDETLDRLLECAKSFESNQNNVLTFQESQELIYNVACKLQIGYTKVDKKKGWGDGEITHKVLGVDTPIKGIAEAKCVMNLDLQNDINKFRDNVNAGAVTRGINYAIFISHNSLVKQRMFTADRIGGVPVLWVGRKKDDKHISPETLTEIAFHIMVEMWKELQSNSGVGLEKNTDMQVAVCSNMERQLEQFQNINASIESMEKSIENLTRQVTIQRNIHADMKKEITSVRGRFPGLDPSHILHDIAEHAAPITCWTSGDGAEIVQLMIKLKGDKHVYPAESVLIKECKMHLQARLKKTDKWHEQVKTQAKKLIQISVRDKKRKLDQAH